MWTMEIFEPIYQGYLNSGMNIREYCKSKGIPESRFHRWQRRMRREAAAASANNDSFIPVSINNHSGKVVMVDSSQPKSIGTCKPQGSSYVTSPSPASQIEVSYNDGTIVKLTGPIDRDILVTLLSR